MEKNYKDLDKAENNVMEEKKDLGQNDLLEKNFKEIIQEIPEIKKENKTSEVRSKGAGDLFKGHLANGERRKWKKPFHLQLQTEKLGMWRRSRATSGGRSFSTSSLVLVKDEEKKAIAFAYSSGKEAMIAFRKSIRKAQKNLITYFPFPPRTISHDITVSYKATKVFLKPAPPGSGIKAGSVLNKLFKFLEIKDISAKIIGSRRNKLNVMRAALMALDKLTARKNHHEY